MRRVDQTYTLIDVSLSEYPEEQILKLKTQYPSLALARISATKFNTTASATLKFYVYHWLHTDYAAVVQDIYNYFNKYAISKKVVGHR